MGYQPQDFEDDWAGREPDQPPPRNRTAWIVGVVVVGFLVLAICGLSVFLAVVQLRSRTSGAPQDPLAPPPPTDSTTAANVAPTITVNAPAPTNTPLPATAGDVTAPRLETAPTIDGVLSDWPAGHTIASSYRVYQVAGWNGTEDVTAVWQLGWDNNNLYVAVSVTDDTHVQTASGNQIFRGDSVDMQFDTERTADFGDGLSPDDYQITLSPGNFTDLPPSAFRFRGTADGAILDAPGGHNVTLAAQATTDGYDLEAAVPWSDLGLAGEADAGLTIGLALNANDNDTPGTAVQEVMMSHVPARTLTDPTTWGSLTLQP